MLTADPQPNICKSNRVMLLSFIIAQIYKTFAFLSHNIFCISILFFTFEHTKLQPNVPFDVHHILSPEFLSEEQPSAEMVALRNFCIEVMHQLPYEPNDQQIRLIANVCYFVLFARQPSAFILQGFAGTGKTSLIGAIVQTLTQNQIKSVLLAPTGRAAKVFSEYSHHAAFTIHRKIFRQKSYGNESFLLAENKHTDTVFIVDEASMIPNVAADGAAFGSGHLLDDLVQYVYSGHNCRLILVGDSAQLPPIAQDASPALSKSALEAYGLAVMCQQLTDVARQAADSGILSNATLVRNQISLQDFVRPKLNIDTFPDFKAISGEYLVEEISDAYGRDGSNETIIITRSNKRAVLFNSAIRNQILFREDMLCAGDALLVAKNNYFWPQDYQEIDFIANGDTLQVVRLRGEIEHRYGLQFTNATVYLPDYDLEMDVKIILDALFSDTAALSRHQSERMYQEIMAELTGDKAERFRQLKQHPYFNALQVKFAYAVTCHKAQGGQWNNVFIDLGYLAEDAFQQLDFFRWLYTAITRARQQVHLINWPTQQE